jgi:glycine hydroxymethyltransferase
MTTRGVKENDTRKIVDFMDRALQNKDNQEELENIKQEVIEFTKQFPVPAIN